MEQIKAILVREFGEPEVLELVDVERPSPGPGEAVIEVRAIGVNYADTMRRRNQYVEAQDLPFIPGSEVAGVVAEVGEGVEGVVAGDQVVTLLGTGGYAEYAVTRAGNLIPIPDSLDFDEAAAIPLQGLTAYHCIKTSGALKAGESVLIHAAAGGVGTLAVQMAKLLGAGTVIATASSEEKLELALSLGADVLINYTQDDWLEKNLTCLATFGRMVVFGAASRDRGTIVPAALMRRCHAVVGFYLPQIMRRRDLFAPSLREVLGWISTGDLKLTIGATYPLEDAARAHSDLESRRTTGKLILRPQA